MGKYVSSTCAVLVILSQLAVPFAYAQTTTGGATRPTVISVPGGGQATTRPVIVDIPTGQNTQAYIYSNGSQSQKQNGSAEGLAADAVGCSVGQILGSIARAGVSAVIGSIKGIASDALGGVVSSIAPTEVPVNDKDTRGNTAKVANKETGGGSASFADAITGALDGVSWDSIGFCLANATIQYLTQATVNWINGGFEGNPVFVDNPGKFFQDLADIEFGAFVQELGVGFLCSGVAPKVRIALVNDYVNRTGGKTFKDKYKCSFEQVGTNLEAFVNNFENGGIDAFVEFVYNPASRPSTAFLAAKDELNRRVSAKQGQAQFELRVTDFLNFKKCDTVRDPKTGKDTQQNCKTYTPGQMIEEQANNAINSPRNRLEIADEFDEVIGALVNQLIKAALSEITNSGSTESKADNTEQIEVEDTQPITISDGGTTGGYRPVPVPAVSGVCRVSTTTVAVDEPLELSVIPRGGNGQYLFDWLGSVNFPTSTTESNLVISFATTTDASDLSVRIRSGGKTAVAPCPDVRVTPPVPLEVSCAPNDASVGVGDTVVWESTVSGGTSYYLYKWSGDISSYASESQDNTVVYNEKGTYRASLMVTSGSQTKQVACDGSVRVR